MRAWFLMLAVAMLCGCAEMERDIWALQEQALEAESAIGAMRLQLDDLDDIAKVNDARSLDNTHLLLAQDLRLVVAETKTEALEEEVAEVAEGCEILSFHLDAYSTSVNRHLGRLDEHIEGIEVQLGRIILVEAQIQALRTELGHLDESVGDCARGIGDLATRVDAIEQGLSQNQGYRCRQAR